MSTISKEAREEAYRLMADARDTPLNNVAAALQRHMDATARWREQYDTLDECCDAQKRRAEKAEALADRQNEELQAIAEPWEQAKRRYEAGAAVVLGFKERAEAAEARAEARWNEKEALAWDRDQLLERVQELERERDGARRTAKFLVRLLDGEKFSPVSIYEFMRSARAYPDPAGDW